MKGSIKYMTSLALVLVAITSSLAQEKQLSLYKGNVTVTPLEVKQQKDSLYIVLDFKMKELQVTSRKSAEFVPILISSTKTQSLPRVSFKGRNNYNTHLRLQYLMRNSEKAYDAMSTSYAVEKGYRRRNGNIAYRIVMPYEVWMADAHLDLQIDDCGCGNYKSMTVQHLADNVMLDEIVIVPPYEMTPSLAYVKPVVETVKRRDIQTEVALDFAVSKTDIRPDYLNNPKELGKIRQMLEELKSDKNIDVKGITITGYASPEGSLATNKLLSEGRANALKNYLSSVYDFSRSIYSISFGGENWDGLVQILNADGYEYKDEVVSIIQNTPIEKDRKKKIMGLHGGTTYRQMLNEIYPRLRTAVCKVDYNVKNFDVAEAEIVFRTAPQNLSLNEMYDVANQYEQGSQEFNDIFETAVRMFPDDQISNLNAASSALARKDIVSAQRYLNKMRTKVRIPEYDNALGVLEMLKGDYQKAEQYLNSAKQAGLKEAQANLDELANKLDNLKQIEEAELKNSTNPNYNR